MSYPVKIVVRKSTNPIARPWCAGYASMYPVSAGYEDHPFIPSKSYYGCQLSFAPAVAVGRAYMRIADRLNDGDPILPCDVHSELRLKYEEYEVHPNYRWYPTFAPSDYHPTF